MYFQNYHFVNTYKGSMNKILTISAALILIIQAASAKDDPEMVTDRPDQTESANIVSPGYMQIETGFVYSSDTYSINMGDITDPERMIDAEFTALSIATTLVRIGITDFAEFRAASAYSLYNQETGPHTTESRGIEPVVLGMKARISGRKSLIQSAVIINVTTPAGYEDFTPEYLQPEIILAFAKDITENISIGWNTGAAWNNSFNPAIPEYIYSIALGIGITENIGGFIEWYGRTPEDYFAQHQLDGGLTYSILPNLQLDVSGGAAATEDSPDWFVNAGLSWMFPLR